MDRARQARAGDPRHMAKAMPGVDLNDYSETNRAITPYANLAREARTCHPVLPSQPQRRGRRHRRGIAGLDHDPGQHGHHHDYSHGRRTPHHGDDATLWRQHAETYLDIDEATGRVEPPERSGKLAAPTCAKTSSTSSARPASP